ncbi:MAG: hypothetical protein AAFQ78_02160 [Bacteroidota bacterium]
MEKKLLLYLFSLASLLCFTCNVPGPTDLEKVESPGNIIEQIEDATLEAAIELVIKVRGKATELRKEATRLRQESDKAAQAVDKAVKKLVQKNAALKKAYDDYSKELKNAAHAHINQVHNIQQTIIQHQNTPRFGFKGVGIGYTKAFTTAVNNFAGLQKIAQNVLDKEEDNKNASSTLKSRKEAVKKALEEAKNAKKSLDIKQKKANSALKAAQEAEKKAEEAEKKAEEAEKALKEKQEEEHEGK